MKKLSIPPFIIFLDLLFMFLFIFILNEKTVIQIKTLGNYLPDGVKIIYYNDALKGYYNLDSSLYNKNRIYTYYGNCNSNIEKCREAKEKYGSKIYIAYSKKIQDEIANFSLITLGTGKCSKMIFIVKKQGTLDYRKMVDKNPCIKKVSNYQKLFDLK